MSAPSARGCGIVLCFLATLGAPARTEPARFELDPDHITLGFMVEHLGYAKVLGMFRSARGSYSFDEATMGVSARGGLKRSTYGMTYGLSNNWVSDEVPFMIEFEALRK